MINSIGIEERFVLAVFQRNLPSTEYVSIRFRRGLGLPAQCLWCPWGLSSRSLVHGDPPKRLLGSRQKRGSHLKDHSAELMLENLFQKRFKIMPLLLQLF